MCEDQEVPVPSSSVTPNYSSEAESLSEPTGTLAFSSRLSPSSTVSTLLLAMQGSPSLLSECWIPTLVSVIVQLLQAPQTF